MVRGKQHTDGDSKTMEMKPDTSVKCTIAYSSGSKESTRDGSNTSYQGSPIAFDNRRSLTERS